MSGFWQPGWHWMWLVGLVILLAAPLFLRCRLTYATAWSVVLVLAILFLWVRNRNGYEQVLFGFPRYTPTVGVGRTFSLWSSVDVVGLAYLGDATTKGLRREDWKEGLWVTWGRTLNSPVRYPESGGSAARRWGFKIFCFEGHPDPQRGFTQWRAGIAMPNWFAMLILSIVPALSGAPPFQAPQGRPLGSRGPVRQMRVRPAGDAGALSRVRECGATAPVCRRTAGFARVAAGRRRARLILKTVHRPPSFSVPSSEF